MARKSAKKSPAQLDGDDAEASLQEGAVAVLQEGDTELSQRPMLSTSIPILNLACSGRADGGIPKGRFIRFFGESGSAKTEMMLALLAEAVASADFKKHLPFYQDVERGNLFDIAARYGKRLESRLKWDYPISVDDAFFALHDRLDKEEALVAILDSFDALTTKQEAGKLAEKMAARGTSKKVTGDYGDGKAKSLSSHLRQILPKLAATDSVLIGVSQVRDDIGSMFGGETTSGGRAIQFYASMEIHTREGKAIKKTINGIDRKIGKHIKVRVVKNRVTGMDMEILIPHYPTLGFDPTGASVDWLVAEKHWGDSAGRINAVEYGLEKSPSREKLIQWIEEAPERMQILNDTITAVWAKIKAAMLIVRKPRYE